MKANVLNGRRGVITKHACSSGKDTIPQRQRQLPHDILELELWHAQSYQWVDKGIRCHPPPPGKLMPPPRPAVQAASGCQTLPSAENKHSEQNGERRSSSPGRPVDAEFRVQGAGRRSFNSRSIRSGVSDFDRQTFRVAFSKANAPVLSACGCR